MTAMVLAVAPSVIFFVLLQKHIVKGVIAGAVKGKTRSLWTRNKQKGVFE